MTNVGMIDRVARTVVGLLLIAFAIPLGFPNTGWNWVGWIGVIPLLTAVFGYCPAYTLLGINTCPFRQQRT
jgi:apolipoprotein N-acyltransferase